MKTVKQYVTQNAITRNTITSPKKIPAVEHSLSFHSSFVLSRVKKASQWLVKEEGRGSHCSLPLESRPSAKQSLVLITLYLPVVQYLYTYQWYSSGVTKGGVPRVSRVWGDTILWSETISPLIYGEDSFSVLIWTKNHHKKLHSGLLVKKSWLHHFGFIIESSFWFREKNEYNNF